MYYYEQQSLDKMLADKRKYSGIGVIPLVASETVGRHFTGYVYQYLNHLYLDSETTNETKRGFDYASLYAVDTVYLTYDRGIVYWDDYVSNMEAIPAVLGIYSAKNNFKTILHDPLYINVVCEQLKKLALNMFTTEIMFLGSGYLKYNHLLDGLKKFGFTINAPLLGAVQTNHKDYGRLAMRETYVADKMHFVDQKVYKYKSKKYLESKARSEEIRKKRQKLLAAKKKQQEELKKLESSNTKKKKSIKKTTKSTKKTTKSTKKKSTTKKKITKATKERSKNDKPRKTRTTKK